MVKLNAFGGVAASVLTVHTEEVVPTVTVVETSVSKELEDDIANPIVSV